MQLRTRGASKWLALSVLVGRGVVPRVAASARREVSAAKRERSQIRVVSSFMKSCPPREKNSARAEDKVKA